MRIMIVEDEMLLALDLESEVEAAGHEVTGLAMSGAEGRNLLAVARPDFALVDIHLLDGPTGLDVGRELADERIPFVLVSGNIKRIPSDFAGALGAIEKPYTLNSMKNVLEYLSAVVAGDDSVSPPPSLVLAEDAYPDAGQEARESDL